MIFEFVEWLVGFVEVGLVIVGLVLIVGFGVINIVVLDVWVCSVVVWMWLCFYVELLFVIFVMCGVLLNVFLFVIGIEWLYCCGVGWDLFYLMN